MENTKITDAIEYGERLRRARQAKNMSQQALADEYGTTPQNVSKWEKNGITNIMDIQRLSQILGQDLMSDERDIEGTVGEIGNEILRLIGQANGMLSFETLLDGMYGLDKSTTTNEVFKLASIGLCVREQYINFYDKECDVIFITAKGLIHLNRNSDRGEFDLSKIKTFEQILDIGEKKSITHSRCTRYQDVIDGRPDEKIIRNLPSVAYKSDFIRWMKSVFVTTDTEHIRVEDYEEIFLAGPYKAQGFYPDIVYQMAMGYTADRLIGYYEYPESIFYAEQELEDVTDKGLNIYSGSTSLQMAFEGLFSTYKEKIEQVRERGEIVDDAAKAEINSLKNTINNYITEEDDSDTVYEVMVNKTGKIHPMDWFSDEEIEKFVIDNIADFRDIAYRYHTNDDDPTSEQYADYYCDYLDKIDEKLRKLGQIQPEIYRYFGVWNVPRSWFGGKMEKMIREVYEIPDSVNLAD